MKACRHPYQIESSGKSWCAECYTHGAASRQAEVAVLKAALNDLARDWKRAEDALAIAVEALEACNKAWPGIEGIVRALAQIEALKAGVT